MVCYENSLQYFGYYPRNDIPTNFQKYKINTAIHCLCYRHIQAQIARKLAPFDFCFEIKVYCCQLFSITVTTVILTSDRGDFLTDRINAADIQGRVLVHITGEVQHQRIREE